MRATAGNYDTQIFEGSISGPITDWLRYRVAGNAGGQGEGFFQDANSNETEGGAERRPVRRGAARVQHRRDDGRLVQVRPLRVGPGAPRRPPQSRRTTSRRRSSAACSGRDLRPRSCSRTPTFGFTGEYEPGADRRAHLRHRHAVPHQARRRRHLHAGDCEHFGWRRPEVRRRLPGLHVPAGLRLRRRRPRSVHA